VNDEAVLLMLDMKDMKHIYSQNVLHIINSIGKIYAILKIQDLFPALRSLISCLT
jgi:hypothetical protein